MHEMILQTQFVTGKLFFLLKLRFLLNIFVSKQFSTNAVLISNRSNILLKIKFKLEGYFKITFSLLKILYKRTKMRTFTTDAALLSKRIKKYIIVLN